MKNGKEVLRQGVVKDLLARRQTRKEAAQKLGVTLRTVQNYVRRFLVHGPEGLKDRRTGNHHKLTPTQRVAILSLKRERPQRSARLIRDRLGLKVTPETVRLVLVKQPGGRPL